MLAQDRPKSHGMTTTFKDYGKEHAEHFFQLWVRLKEELTSIMTFS